MTFRADINALDRDDPLAACRERIVLPDSVIYLDGNSLGPAPRAVAADLAEAVAQEWSTDLYILDGLKQQRSDLMLRLEGRDGKTLDDMIAAAVAVVVVNQVDYKSAALRDMVALTVRAHDAGAVVIWDLCHSAGVMPIALDACDADFAMGCTYKYLNGGPGAPGFLYVPNVITRPCNSP